MHVSESRWCCLSVPVFSGDFIFGNLLLEDSHLAATVLTIPYKYVHVNLTLNGALEDVEKLIEKLFRQNIVVQKICLFSIWLSEKPNPAIRCWWHDVTLRGWENKTRVKTEKLNLPEGLIFPTPGSWAGNLVDIQRSNAFFFWVFHKRSWGPAAKTNANKKLELEILFKQVSYIFWHYNFCIKRFQVIPTETISDFL